MDPYTGRAIHWPTIRCPHIQQLSSVVATSHGLHVHIRFKTWYLRGIAALRGKAAPAALQADRRTGGVMCAAHKEAGQIGALPEPLDPCVTFEAQQEKVRRGVDQRVASAASTTRLPVMDLSAHVTAQFACGTRPFDDKCTNRGGGACPPHVDLLRREAFTASRQGSQRQPYSAYAVGMP